VYADEAMDKVYKRTLYEIYIPFRFDEAVSEKLQKM
jgi:hypothetical protein